MNDFSKLLVISAVLAVSLLMPGLSQAQQAAAPLGHVSEAGTPWAQIETPDQAVVYANAQNLVARWNNVIIFADTGDEQLQIMRESGVFADDVELKFILPDGTVLAYDNLAAGPRDFYNSFVNDLKKGRFNTAANVEALEFLGDGLRFRFRHSIFMGETFSLGGHNEIVMRRVDGRFVVTEATIHVLHFDIQHAY